jgi:hypothetical protein
LVASHRRFGIEAKTSEIFRSAGSPEIFCRERPSVRGYKKLAEQVMLATDASRIMKDQGANPPAIGFGKEIILGREFDSDKPEEYLKSIKKF